jgi:hypothetical protein
VVPAPDLRARLLHRLRREDRAWRPRSDRAAHVEGGRRRGRPRRRGHRPRGRFAGPRDDDRDRTVMDEGRRRGRRAD